MEDFDSGVFVNCPFDDRFLPLLRPLLFTIEYCGYQAVLSSSRSDSLEIRLNKITSLIGSTRLCIHDLSRIQADEVGEYYRLNMPFEIGLDYGARQYGSARQQTKLSLVMAEKRFDYMKAISDLAGIDIAFHNGEAEEVVSVVRNWFAGTVQVKKLTGPSKIWGDFNDFMYTFHKERQADGFSDKDLEGMPISEFVDFLSEWIDTNVG